MSKFWSTCIIFVSTILIHVQCIFAQSANIELAKKEGELLFYVSTRAEDANQISAMFMKKYPFIKATYYRSGSDPLFQRMITESRAGQHLFDVVSIKAPIMISLKERRILAPYKSVHQSAYGPGFYDPEGFWTDTYDLYYTIAYNTKLVSANNIPRKWQDLLLPQWADGKICMDPRLNDWYAGMKEALAPLEGSAFMERLRKQKPAFREGHSLIAQLLGAGEFPLAITYAHTVEQLKSRGAPIDWITLDPMVAISQPIALSARAPHPNAGKLFIDFMLSGEGANLLKLQQRIPARLDVEPVTERLNPKKLKLHPVNIAIEKLDPIGFRKFFGLQ
jgi:iron(III) transport system substrate-binding protein